MKNLSLLFLALPLMAQAQSVSTAYLCSSENPRGAIALEFVEGGTSKGRISHNWTRSWEDLLTADKDQYTNLNVGFVQKLAPEHYTFNASVYGLVKNPQVIALTKSELKDGKLKFFVGADQYMNMTCKKVKELK